jgi:DHA1 family bicyclomycin/chloramphenicol resistance-like MFS transporter
MPSTKSPREISFAEFVILVSLLTGMIAFSIDNLLPAFDSITRSFALDANQSQLIIISFMLSFGIMQLFYGPLSDRFGRRPILLFGLGLYLLGSLLGFLSTDFTTLLLGRLLQGIGAAAPRVLSVAIVRDRYAGREMARVLSLTMMMFIIIPIIAPTIGSLFLMFGNWRLIFLAMFLFAGIVTIWLAIRLPETLVATPQTQSIVSQTLSALPHIFKQPETIGNATGMSLMMGCLMTYLVSAPEIFETGIYNLHFGFAYVFAIIAFFMGAAAFTNSQLVRKVGMHRLSRIGLFGFVFVASLLVIESVIFAGRPPLVMLIATLAVAHFLFSLTVPNLNAIAMEPVGAIAGTAASFIGFYSTLISSTIGYGFGKAFNGTILPLSLCYLAMSSLTLLTVFWIRWRSAIPALAPDPARP